MVDEQKRPQSAGLKWRKRANGPDVPYWFADPKATAAGYPIRSANLALYAGNPLLLKERAERLQSEMLLWMSGYKKSDKEFDGTFRSLLEIYQRDPKSSFNTSLKPGTVRLYTTYLKKLIPHIGARRIDLCDGRDVMGWFESWRAAGDGSGRDQLSVARVCLAIVKAAISFGVVCRAKGCPEFQAILGELEFDALPRRTQAPTAAQIIAVRKAAHAAGFPLRALAYAIQFETTLRQWDVIGQWVPLSNPKPSAIIHRGKKWIGPTWAAIDDRLILAKIEPTKTEDTTAVEVSFDLSVCPMVTEELAMIPMEKRTGPLIIKEMNGRPYDHDDFRIQWRRDAEAAGVPKAVWNRDIRAGGVTEGGKSGASRDDRRTVAGHSAEKMTERYERGTVSLEAHRRVMKERTDFRGKEK
jgi:hypothetical protein